MGTTTALELNRIVHQQIGDWIEVATTTLITNTNTHVISTNLRQYDNGRDDAFTAWWLYVTDKNNAGTERRIRNYYTANAVCNVYGAVWATDTAQANVRIHRYPYAEVQRALNDALRETYPRLHRELDNPAAITTNSLLYQYDLPAEFQSGEVRQVLVNAAGSSAEDTWERIVGYNIINMGQAIQLPDLYTTGRKIRLLGTTPLETVTNTGDTVNVDGFRLNLLAAYAKYKFFQQYAVPVSTEDRRRYKEEAMDSYAEYQRLLPSMAMQRPVGTLNLKTY